MVIDAINHQEESRSVGVDSPDWFLGFTFWEHDIKPLMSIWVLAVGKTIVLGVP